MSEIPEEAYERATDAIAALVNSWPASASHPFHPELGVRGTLRAFAIYALEAAALPHLRVQETPSEGCPACGYPSLYRGSCTECGWSPPWFPPTPHPRPVVDREALAALLLYEEGSEWAEGTNRHYELADAVLALLPTEEGEGS